MEAAGPVILGEQLPWAWFRLGKPEYVKVPADLPVCVRERSRLCLFSALLVRPSREPHIIFFDTFHCHGSLSCFQQPRLLLTEWEVTC